MPGVSWKVPGKSEAIQSELKSLEILNSDAGQSQRQQFLTQQRRLKHSHSGLPFDGQQMAQLLLADLGLSKKIAFALADAYDVQQPVCALRRQPVTHH